MLLILKLELTHVRGNSLVAIHTSRLILTSRPIHASRPILTRLNLCLLLIRFGQWELFNRRPPHARNSTNPLPPQPAPLLRAKGHARNPIVLPLDILPVQRAGGKLSISILPLHDAVPRGVRNAELAKSIVQLAAVFLGNIPAVNVRLERGEHLMRREDENLGDGIGVEPALDPAPDGAEEKGRANDKDAVERLGVVSGGKLRRRLHVALEVPELLQADAGDVDNVGAEGDGHVGALAVGELRGKRLAEARQVFVEGEQAEKARRRLAVGVGFGKGGIGALAFVVGYAFGVEGANLKDVERDAAAVSSAGPLGILEKVKMSRLVRIVD